MIKAILIADGPRIPEAVARMVETCCPNVSLVARAQGVREGVGAINEHEPDLVIADTKLSDGSGFDLVRHFDKPDFKIIFLSSSIDYAVKAIKFNAVDYIIKPIDEEELTLAVNKAVDMIRFEENLQQKALKEYEELLLEHDFHRIHKSHIFNIHKISHLDKANGGYVVMIDGARVPVASRKRDMLLELFDGIK